MCDPVEPHESKLSAQIYKLERHPQFSIYIVRVRFKLKIMRIEFILTYNSKPQEMVAYPFVNPILKNKQILFEFATAQLSDEEKQDLVKISSCILIDGGNFEEPEWYSQSNGKLWIENGVLS